MIDSPGPQLHTERTPGDQFERGIEDTEVTDMISDLQSIGEAQKMCFEALMEFYFSPGDYHRMNTELLFIFVHYLELCIAGHGRCVQSRLPLHDICISAHLISRQTQ